MPPPFPFSVYLALRANDQVRRFINIHLHYITTKIESTETQGLRGQEGEWGIGEREKKKKMPGGDPSRLTEC